MPPLLNKKEVSGFLYIKGNLLLKERVLKKRKHLEREVIGERGRKKEGVTKNN